MDDRSRLHHRMTGPDNSTLHSPTKGIRGRCYRSYRQTTKTMAMTMIGFFLSVMAAMSLFSSSALALAMGHPMTDDNGEAHLQRQSPKRRRLLRREFPQPRIMGGTPVDSNTEYPFFAYWDLGCGATLVAPDMLLSAAHCYIDEGRTDDRGQVYLNSIEYEKGNVYDVIDVIPHPQFNGDYYSEPKYDFILVQINETIPPEIATPVLLNDNPLLPSDNDDLTVIGFGSFDEKGNDYPDQLQQVTLPFLPTSYCQVAWSDTTITDAELCTLYPEGGMDSCYGDSGGPLLASTPFGWAQVGIVSWGDSCGLPDAPAVAARVSAVADSWIRPQVCLTSVDPPLYCQGLRVELPLSLRIDLASEEETPWQLQNISWGLYQISPPLTVYEVDADGVVYSNLEPPIPPPQSSDSTALSRKKDDKKDDDDDEYDPITSLHFPNLTPGLYYFRIQQDVQDLVAKGTLQHFRVVQGRNYTARSWLEHAWVDVDGSTFNGFTHEYLDLQSNRLLSNVQLPVTDPLPFQPQIVELTIDVFYDLAPNETAWELRNMDTNEIITIIRQGTVMEPGLVRYPLEVPVDTELQFRIWDLVGDGICCSDDKGNGWVVVWAGVRRIWHFDGIFESELSAMFEIVL